MIKFTAKVGLAYAAVYYLKEEGIWKNADESSKVGEKLKEIASPYVTKVKESLPFQLPDIPPRAKLSEMTKIYWNTGVQKCFEFLRQLPRFTNDWSQKNLESLYNSDFKASILSSGGGSVLEKSKEVKT